MKYELFCYYDRISGLYGIPFPSTNKATALRQMSVELAKMDPQISSDYELYLVGDYDTETGCINSLDKPVFVGRYGEGADINE